MSDYRIEFGPEFEKVVTDLAQISDGPVELIEHVLSSGCLQILEKDKPKKLLTFLSFSPARLHITALEAKNSHLQVALETCRKIAETAMTMLRNDVSANLDKPPDVFHHTLYKTVRGIVDRVNIALNPRLKGV